MGSERDGTHVILIKDKPLSAVKADLIHAFLFVSFVVLFQFNSNTIRQLTINILLTRYLI